MSLPLITHWPKLDPGSTNHKGPGCTFSKTREEPDIFEKEFDYSVFGGNAKYL